MGKGNPARAAPRQGESEAKLSFGGGMAAEARRHVGPPPAACCSSRRTLLAGIPGTGALLCMPALTARRIPALQARPTEQPRRSRRSPPRDACAWTRVLVLSALAVLTMLPCRGCLSPVLVAPLDGVPVWQRGGMAGRCGWRLALCVACRPPARYPSRLSHQAVALRVACVPLSPPLPATRPTRLDALGPRRVLLVF